MQEIKQTLSLKAQHYVVIALWIAVIIGLMIANKLAAIPLITLGGSLWFLFVSIRISQSGSWKKIHDGKTYKWVEGDGNVPIQEIPQFRYLCLPLFLATIVTLIAILAER